MVERHDLPAAALQVALACGLCTFFYLMTLSSAAPGWGITAGLILFAPAIYAADRLFLRRERTMLSLVLLNGGAAAAVFGAILAVDSLWELSGAIFVGLFCACIALRGAQLALNPPKLHSMILGLDLSALCLVLFLCFLSATQHSVLWAIPGAAGFSASLLGVILCRISRPLGLRDWLLVGAAFGGLVLLVWLLVGVAAAPAGHGLVAAWTALVDLVKYLLGLVWKFIVFLTSLLPTPEYDGEMDSSMELYIPSSQEEAGEGDPRVAAVMLVLMGLGVLALAVWGLWRLSRVRISAGTRKKAAAKVGRQRPSLVRGLGRLFSQLALWVRLKAFLWRNRNTAVGLYYLLVARCRLSPWHKRTGETPREFLGRMRQRAEGDRELVQALDGLIPAVDRALYSPGGGRGPVPGAGLIRRRIGRAARRRFLLDCREGLEGLFRGKRGVDKGEKLC